MTEQEIKYEANKMLLKMLEKDKEKIYEKLNNNSQKRKEHKISIIVKGYEVSNEKDLDELIAGDVINSTQYCKYLRKLKDIQQQVKFNNNEDVLNYILKCLKNLTFSLQDDIYLYENPDADAINSLDEAYSIIDNVED